jgi:hypothetical protein
VDLTRCIAVDVDDTLIRGGVVDGELVAWVEAMRGRGWFVMLWSARGLDHARQAAELSGIAWDAVVPKPGVAVDDVGWGWVRHTVALPPCIARGGQWSGS